MPTEVWLSASAPRVRVGSRVVIRDDEGEDVFVVVETGEADVGAGFLSVGSPLGQALLGHVTGDRVIFQAPCGRRSVRIVAVDTGS